MIWRKSELKNAYMVHTICTQYGLSIWSISYGPYDMGVNPVNHKVRGSFWANAKFKIILERKCLKVRKAKMHNPRMGVPEIKKDFDLWISLWFLVRYLSSIILAKLSSWTGNDENRLPHRFKISKVSNFASWGTLN